MIVAVVLEGRTQGEVARGYGVSQGRIRRRVTRYRDDSEAAQVSLFLVGEAGAAGRVLGVTAPGERVGEGFLQWTVRNPTARARLVSRANWSAEDR